MRSSCASGARRVPGISSSARRASRSRFLKRGVWIEARCLMSQKVGAEAIGGAGTSRSRLTVSGEAFSS